MTLFGRHHVFTMSVALIALLAILAGSLGAPTVAADAQPTIVEIRAAHHPGYDRIVFEFQGGQPQASKVRWADVLRLDPSDKPANVQGNAFLRVNFRWATAHELEPPANSTYGPARRAFDLPNVAHVVLLGDYEGVVTFGVGLMKRTRILKTIQLSHPSRFVIDVSTTFPKRRTTVYFVDHAAVVAGREPYVVPVQRTVPRGSRPKSALLRLYAGPTMQELAAGLRFIPSRTTGFGGLWVNDRGVARVTLRGRCDSGGSALVTVASQITPTLRSIPPIKWVKIYDRQGQTERPWGQTDSIPGCLEP